jgi:hypothetical protein
MGGSQKVPQKYVLLLMLLLLRGPDSQSLPESRERAPPRAHTKVRESMNQLKLTS